MVENNRYTKGEFNEVVKRFSQIHTIKMKCPIKDEGMEYFHRDCEIVLKKHKENGNFVNVPVNDVFYVFLYVLSKLGKISNECISVDVTKLQMMHGFLKCFNNLKYITLEFTDDDKVFNAYNDLNDCGYENDENKKLEKLSLICDIEIVEINLSDIFSQEVIDIFNQNMISNGLISNSYLNREFYVNFDYDGYVSYMDMFLTNNGMKFEYMDSNIIEYYRLFPVYVANNKPMIRIITNYRDI